MKYEELRSIKKNRWLKSYTEKGSEGALKRLLECQLLTQEEIEEHIPKDVRRKKEIAALLKRPENDILPESIVAKYGAAESTKLTSIAHWIIRRELQYVGDQFAPDRTLRYVVSRCTHYNNALRNWETFKSLYERETHTAFPEDWKAQILSGQAVIFSVDLENGQQYIIKNFGWLVAFPTGGGKHTVYTLFDTVSMLEQNFDIIDTVGSIKDAFETLVPAEDNVVYRDIKDYAVLGLNQRHERKPPMTQEELVEFREHEYLMKQAEDEAFRSHCSIEEAVEKIKRERAEHEAEKLAKEQAKKEKASKKSKKEQAENKQE